MKTFADILEDAPILTKCYLRDAYLQMFITHKECHKNIGNGLEYEVKWNLTDAHMYKQFGNSVTVNVIEEIAKEIKKILI